MVGRLTRAATVAMHNYKQFRHKSGVFRDVFPISIGSAAVIATTLLTIVQVQAAGLPIESMLISKRPAEASAHEDMSLEDSLSDAQAVRYDEYPVVVPKRAALIIDRLLKEIEAAKDNSRIENDWGAQMTRRGNKEKIYFRCYFNAVSCYRRK